MALAYDQQTSALPPVALPNAEPAVDFGSNAALAAEIEPSSASTPLLDAASAQGGKAGALADHDRSVARIEHLMRSALSQDIPEGEDDASRLVLLRNSAEWIESGKIGLQVLDPTHDSDQRAPQGKVAYFDTRVDWDSGAADYDETDLANNAGIAFSFPESGHFDPSTQTMVFAEACRWPESDLANTFIHEIQHACDSGPGNDFEKGVGTRPVGKYDAPVWVYRGYASEYRARVIDPIEASKYGDPTKPVKTQVDITATRDPSDPDVVSGKVKPTATVKTAFTNEQQEQIWADMIRDSSPTVWFDYQTREWTQIYGYYAHHYALDPNFKKYVDQLGATGEVSGGNQVNSIRIDELAQVIADGRPALVVVTVAKDLDNVDIAFLQDLDRSGRFWQAAIRHLATRMPLYARLQSMIMGRTTIDPASETYTVVAGDTLTEIAERILGDRAYLDDLLRLNPQITDPDVIEVGDRLTLPSV